MGATQKEVSKYLNDLKEYNGPDTPMKPLSPFVAKKFNISVEEAREFVTHWLLNNK